MSAIPVIDLRRPPGRVAAEIGAACRDTGFFTIVGHGVDAAIMQAVYGASEAFFALPAAQKQKVGRPRPEQNRGFIAMGTETLARLGGKDSPPDHKEVFTIGPDAVPDEPYYTAAAAYPNFAPNLWPERPESLKPALLAYWRALEAMAARLLRHCAQALDLPGDVFAPITDRHISMLRIIDYPPYRVPPQPGQLRAGVHTDLNMLTIVHSNSSVGGIEVKDRTGAWIAPPADPDAFIVNIGDVMMRWTNDLWVSTPHRVVNPPGEHAHTTRRLSLAFFFQANYDAMIECLPTCVSDARPARYPPTTVGAYRTARFAATANAPATPATPAPA